MVKNKLHIIGCSFSTHRFFDLEPGDYPNDPSNYARIVASNLNLEPIAYAREGQGNGFMLDELKKHRSKFGKDDIVLVQLSQPDRLKTFIKGYGDMKLGECLEPNDTVLELTGCSREDFQTFGYIYDKFFFKIVEQSDLWCNAIIGECLSLPCKSIVLPLHNKEDFQEKYKNFDTLAIAENPWSQMSAFSVWSHDDNLRFDHMDDKHHNMAGHNIIRDIQQSNCTKFFENV